MRTLLLLGVAATTSMISDVSHATTHQPAAPKTEVASMHPPRAGANYDPVPYEDSYAREEYRGEYGDGYDPQRSYRYDRRYSDADMARMCQSDDGLGGAVIGGVVGGVVGNRVAGRGDRGIGTAVGAVAGAAVGGTIDRNADRRRCDDYHRRVAYERDYQQQYGARGDYYQGNVHHQGCGYYQGGSYGYYTVPETIVTTEYVPYTTVTTTTETSYDYIYPAARTKRVLAKKRVHRPKRAIKRPTCICR